MEKQMQDLKDLIKKAYAAFNERDIDTALSTRNLKITTRNLRIKFLYINLYNSCKLNDKSHYIKQITLVPNTKAGVLITNIQKKEGSHNISRPHRDEGFFNAGFYRS